MSDHRYRNKHRSLWPPRRVSTRRSASQATIHYDATHHYDNTPTVVSSTAVDIPAETVIVHVPGVTSARSPVSDGHGHEDSPRLMQLLQSHAPSMSVSQTVRGDMPSVARFGSDDEESHNGTRNSAFVVHPADVHPTMSEPAVRSTGMHSRPVQTGPICTTPGLCQAGGELRLAHLSGKSVQVSEGFVLVGAKSPMLPGMMLVAEVDRRFLPDEKNSVTMLGFSGNCIGCGAKGFRYFTEFSSHINLKLATQPKKQKHLKYYIITEPSGRVRKGPAIPWKVEGRKRTFPLTGPYIPVPYTSADSDIPSEMSRTSVTSAPLHLLSLQSHSSSVQGKGMVSPRDEGVLLMQSTHQNTSEQTYHPGLPIKRRRWESGGSESPIESDDGHSSDTAKSAPGSDASELPSEPWLTTACGVRPVLLLCQHSIPKISCSVEDIIISDLLVGCFDPPLVSDRNQFGNISGVYSTAPSSSSCAAAAERSFYGSVPCLTTQMAVLLMVQYLSQFVDDDRISREDVESLLQDARLELTASVQQQSHLLAQSNAVTHVQLPVLASLTAANSKGRVKIVSSPVSLDNAIFRALKFVLEIHRHNQSKFPKVPVPDFIFVLATSQKKSPEFCLLITSVLQAKYLSEAMIGHPVGARIADNLSRLEQLFKLSSDALEQMISNFEEAMGQGQFVFVPFNGFARTKVMADEAARLEPRAPASTYPQQKQTLFASQHLMAKQLLAQVCTIGENINSLDLNSFTAVSTAIVVPPLTTLFNQTSERLSKSGLLAELDLETADKAGMFKTAAKYVIKHSGADETQEELLKLLEQVQSQPKVLFVVVFDQAQFYASPQGVLDLPYYKEFLEARNVIALFVTATPYLFQTNCSFIDPNNEVYWSDIRTETDGVSISVVENLHNLETNEGTYFGMKEYCESIKWTHQFPLVRQDDAFEKMALRTSRTTDDVNLSVLRCYLLIRHYCAAIMWSAGIKPAEPHCTLKTIQIMREIIESPVHNADGSGAMLVIRIPSVELANLAFESLKNTRDRLGFQFRFAIIHDNGFNELEIEDYFLKRLRLWRDQRGPTKTKSKSVERWSPKCFEDLHDLPCIIIVSGRERPGDTFPRSLKYIDLRLIDRGFVYRSSLELEFSAIACYIGSGTGSRSVEGSESNGQASGEPKDDSNTSSGTICRTSHYSSNYPLPVILVSRSVFKAFQSDFYGYPKHLLLPTTPQTRWVGLGRPPVVTSNPRHQSLYYREWTEPKPKQVPGPQQDASNRQPVITLRSASGVVISPDITDVVEEDGMSAVECFAESNRMTSGTSEGEDSSCEDSKQGVENGGAKKTIRDSNATAKHGHQPVFGPALLHRLYGMAASSRQDTIAGETSIDSSSSRDEAESSRTEKYHPRSILFSGPPQVGKTHSYLHFVRLLHQTVQKLRRVDVYNETVCTPKESSSQTTPVPSGSEQERMAWPVYKEVAKLPFSCLLHEHRYSRTSKLRIHAATGCTVSGDVTSPSVKRSPGRPTCPMMLSCWAAYDTYHHCDGCKNYREGMGPSTSSSYIYTLQCGEKLHFVIPHRCLQNFTFTKEKQLRGLRLPVVLTGGSGEEVKPLKTEGGDGEAVGVVRSPIMMPSTGRHEYGLLNLYHAMEGESHALLVFVKHQEMALYHKAWPNHVIVGLPVSADTQGLGAARFYIKEFATENWVTERDRHAIHGKRGQDVWPFIFMMDDSCVMWQNLLKQTVNKDESSTKDTDRPSSVMTSLLKVLQHLENTPDVLSYGMLGLQQYSADVSTPTTQGSFSHCPLHTSIMMNLSKLHGIKYNPYRYWWEDVNMSLQVLAGGIHTCRFNHLVVAKKCIETGGATAFKEEPAHSTEGSSLNKELLPGDKLVTAPDREDAPYLSVPAYYLLERYLELMGAVRLFPEAADKPDHPVLVVDCYVNLGPRVCLEFVSSHGWDKTKKNDKQDTRYGGLLLYFCGRSVSAAFLAQFKFAPRSRLCLVCQDRNTLRQEVARLDLEEHWRFRLRDEFQTANSPDEPALYFLTGKHDD